MDYSLKTVHVHRANLMEKLGVSNDVELARRMGEIGRERVLAGYGVDRVAALLDSAWRCLDADPRPRN